MGGKKTDGYYMRRLATDRGVALITNVKLAGAFVQAIVALNSSGLDPADLPVRSWKDHVESGHRIQRKEHSLLPAGKRQRLLPNGSCLFSPRLVAPTSPTVPLMFSG